MKAKYEKVINIIDELKEMNFQQRFRLFLTIVPPYHGKRLSKETMQHMFQKEVQKGHLELVYHVKNKLNKKTVRMIQTFAFTRTAIRNHPYFNWHMKKQREVFTLF